MATAAGLALFAGLPRRAAGCPAARRRAARWRASAAARGAAAQPGGALAATLEEALASRLRAAVTAVQAASTLSKGLQARVVAGGLDVKKLDASPVTVADFAAQALVLSSLAAEFSSDGFIAEETSEGLRGAAGDSRLLADVLAAVSPATGGVVVTEAALCEAIDLSARPASGPYTWVLDPIDGTKGFMAGQQFCVGLALMRDGVPVLGLLGCPNDGPGGRLFFAARGGGAFAAAPGSDGRLQEVQLRARKPRVPPEEAAAARFPGAVMLQGQWVDPVRIASVQDLKDALAISTAPLRVDSMVKYGRLAAGEADLVLRLPPRAGYQEHIWDHAAGVVIVEEAGGMITDQRGRPLDFSLGRELSAEVTGIISSAGGALHQAALRAVQGLPPLAGTN